MIELDNVIKENIKEHNPNCPQIPDHPYRILIVGGVNFGFMSKNDAFNLIKNSNIIDEKGVL